MNKNDIVKNHVIAVCCIARNFMHNNRRIPENDIELAEYISKMNVKVERHSIKNLDNMDWSNYHFSDTEDKFFDLLLDGTKEFNISLSVCAEAIGFTLGAIDDGDSIEESSNIFYDHIKKYSGQTFGLIEGLYEQGHL